MLPMLTNGILDSRGIPAGQEGGVEVDHDEALVGGEQAQHGVGHVARDVAQRARRRVREEHGRARHRQRVAHRALRHVREVHQHSQPVHFLHHHLNIRFIGFNKQWFRFAFFPPLRLF